MTFHISSQNAHLINNVAGDQWNQATLRDADALEQVRQLRNALDTAGLAPAVATQARAHLDDAETELAQQTPSKPDVADRLKQVTRILVSAGGLATAGGALLGPLGALAGWLGGLGRPILDMLDRDS
jgi:hypothetical protein